MEKEIRTLTGDTIKVHTFIDTNENGWEEESFKDFSLALSDIAQQKEENVKAIVIKPDIHSPHSFYGVSEDDDFIQAFKDYCLFDSKNLIDKDPSSGKVPYSSTINEYRLNRKFKELLPENCNFIEIETRKAWMERLFPDGISGIISHSADVLKNHYSYDIEIDERFFGKKFLDSEIIASFRGENFVALYIIGNLLAVLATKGVKEVYLISEYGDITVYYDGVTKDEIKQLTKALVQDFNNEFKTRVTLDNPGEKNFKYIQNMNAFTEDRFGNKIGVGDLVISPQGSDSGGSWVDPIIVKGVQNDRIIPDVRHRSYYLADRCILLRSANGVVPKYGDKDFLQGK